MNQFFAVVPPGLEELAAHEIQEVAPFLIGKDGRPQVGVIQNLKIVKGGVEFQTDLLSVAQLHFWSKTVSRFLLRVGRFQAREFYELESRAKKIRMDDWFAAGAPFRLDIEASTSRLNNEKRILRTLVGVWGSRVSDQAELILKVRVSDDQFVFSIDLSGEHLHFRGLNRKLVSRAPLRETLAAALLRYLSEGSSAAQRSLVTLYDPFMGSGTLLSEAAHVFLPVRTRSFAFEKLVSVPKILKSPSFMANYKNLPISCWRELKGFDQDTASGAALEQLQIQSPKESFVFGQLQGPQSPLWVVANPPYGERLRAVPIAELCKVLLAQEPDRLAVILPDAMSDQLARRLPNIYVVETLKVSNGGIPCRFLRALKKF